MSATLRRAAQIATTTDNRLPGVAERYADWLARRERGKGRQATLSRNLSSLTSYRTWAQKVRENWVDDAANATEAPQPPTALRRR
ncbi:MAG: hypothetical protein RL026_1006 [Pseudomonadota bacterium]|jgi:hypothetical protein